MKLVFSNPEFLEGLKDLHSWKAADYVGPVSTIGLYGNEFIFYLNHNGVWLNLSFITKKDADKFRTPNELWRYNLVGRRFTKLGDYYVDGKYKLKTCLPYNRIPKFDWEVYFDTPQQISVAKKIDKYIRNYLTPLSIRLMRAL